MASAAQDVIDATKAYQVVEHPEPIICALAGAATTDVDGEPLWLQIVGGPSSGKTEAISMLHDTVDARWNDLTVAGLLGWIGTPRSGRTSGVLSHLDEAHALVSITDFSAVLADSDRGARARLFAALRDIYDGSWRRDIGNVPKPLTWAGRLTIVSAVTPQIDKFAAHTDALGPRWMYVRVPELSRLGRQEAARRSARLTGKKRALRGEASVLAADVVNAARAAIFDVAPTAADIDILADVAELAARARSDVPRDGCGRRDILGAATIEEPFRLVGMLTLLYRGVLALGLGRPAARTIVTNAALDSIPLDRRRCLEVLCHVPSDEHETYSASAVGKAAHLHRHVARRALEDLEQLDLVASTGTFGLDENADDNDAPRSWALAPNDDGKRAARVIGGVARSVDLLTPLPPNKGKGHPTVRATPGAGRRTS